MADMSKPNALFGEPQAGQPVKTSEGEPAQQTGQQPDLEALIKKTIAESVPSVVNQALETFTRKQQSQRDQQEARITKKINETLDYIRAGGAEPTADQIKAISQKVAQSESSVDLPQTSQQAQGTAQPGSDAVTGMKFDKYALRDEVFELYGVKLEANDPEAAAFVDSDDPAVLMRNLKKAVKAKQERLKGEASGRLAVVSGTGENPGLMHAYQEEINKAERGNVNQRMAILEKYRKQGLKI